MKTIKTIDQLMTLLETDERPMFVRWSNGVTGDRKMGRSTNHASGQLEAGISVNALRSNDGVFNPRGYAAMSLREYAHLAPVGYVLTGEVIARGSDNEAVLDSETWQAVAKIGDAALDEAKDTDPMTGDKIACDHPANMLSRYSGGVVFCNKCGKKVS